IRALNKLAQSKEKFDIIFIGAPYDSPMLEKVLYKLGAAAFLNDAGIVIAEHRKQQKLLEEYGGLKMFREARYGETTLKFYESSNISR
ncbi:MAG: RsmD family RNA methyltransferase, partial [Candidatus Margulisbacteria bacterium]|nr:RsmD family RNA methyltransferase [Candidatus Margulisiibacteriota bacterium]